MGRPNLPATGLTASDSLLERLRVFNLWACVRDFCRVPCLSIQAAMVICHRFPIPIE